jgi:predicted nucleotidyltransferase
MKQTLNTAELLALSQTPPYDFLRNNPHLQNTVIFLTLGGSHAYGTNVEGSDIDIRGVCQSRPCDILGLQQFEQVVDNATDTTVYSFNKLISLLLNCNPNCIELLGCKPEHYFVMTDIGREFIANRKMFLSKKAVHAFGGYATAQLRRLENALARDALPQFRQEEHIYNSVMSSFNAMSERYKQFPEGSIELFIDKSDRDDMETEIFANINLKNYPLRDYNCIWSDMNTVVKEYAKVGKRNNKKTEAGLAKHAMHLVRLYLMCFDILEKEEINTFREHDHDLLMSIRNGKYRESDGTYSQDFFDMISDYEKRLNYANENTSLPENPDYDRIQDWVISVNKKAVL